MDFFLEIYTEEVPAKMQKKASFDLANIAYEQFQKHNLEIKKSSIKSFITPNRQALYIHQLKSEIEIAKSQKFGPQITANEKAIEGFLRANNLTSIKQLKISQNKGKDCYLLEIPKTTIKTSEILTKAIVEILNKMVNQWPKLMRWDVEGFEKQPKWIRPIRNISAICGTEILDFEFANLKSNNITFGLKKNKIKLNRAEDYIDQLDSNNVFVDQERRKTIIKSQINELLKETNLKTFDDINKAQIFDEITHLCENPTALIGSIDDKFLKLPKEILLLTLKNNQKYVCLKDKKGNFANKFIFITNNIINKNNKDKIIKDNEKLVRARFSDVEFFINEDLKEPLINKINNLENIVFHAKLGSLKEKIYRLESIAKVVGVFVPNADITNIEKLTQLAKIDLSTKAVLELPELQGKIGAYYAKVQNEEENIINAIEEQYLPLGPNSNLPQTPLGITLSIADKIDSIVGFYLANEKPTSSKDPYGLRRYVLGIMRMCFEYKIAIPIRISVEKALNSYPLKLTKSLIAKTSTQKLPIAKKQLVEEIIIFFLERLKTYLYDEKGLKNEIINIVIDEYVADLNKHRYCNILYLYNKIKFISNYVQDEANAELLSLYKRSANILKIEENKDNKKFDGKVSRLHLKNKYEKLLHFRLKKISSKFKKSCSNGNFKEAFTLLETTKLPLTQFFDNVLVNDNDQNFRENRLKIINKFVETFNYAADLSKLK